MPPVSNLGDCRNYFFSVYEKIENLSKLPKPRRSKSFSRPNDTSSPISRTSSPQQHSAPQTLNHSSSLPPRSRISSESSGSMATTKLAQGNGLNSRSSFDKTRAMKMFSNSRSSADQGANGSVHESQRSHKRSDSVLSDGTRQTLAAFNGIDREPPSVDVRTFRTCSFIISSCLFQDLEFDDMMRSGSTMKVSLTPDRLKSMEVRYHGVHFCRSLN